LQPLPRSLDKNIELLGLESTPSSIAVAEPLIARSRKIRILGSMAISIALTAGGAFDAFCAPVPMRVFDMAASLLLLREAGGKATDVEGKSLSKLRCDLDSRSSLLCAPTRELHEEAIALLGKRS
jgi:fructose-1,6-bisphosphatase/inositol monophosphatase family enzyme